MTSEQIIRNLPYGPGFCFVDEISAIDEDEITGYYTFPVDAFYYRDHFPGHPITPGVILTECMAQIGLVCLGMYLNREEIAAGTFSPTFAFSDAEVKFRKAVYPNTKVKVVAEKEYYRFKKLKVEVRMEDMKGATICRGHLAGVLVNK
jgi:3-hydroxyacyl-[acyl-carrier-protein] dehydratase